MKKQIEDLNEELRLAHERMASSQGELGKELERLRAEMEAMRRKFQADFEDMQNKLRM